MMPYTSAQVLYDKFIKLIDVSDVHAFEPGNVRLTTCFL